MHTDSVSRSSLERKSFLVLLIALLAAGTYVLSPFLKTVVVAVAFRVLFEPLHLACLKLTRNKPSLSAFFCVSSVFFLFLLPVAGIAMVVTMQMSSLISSVTRHMEDPTVFNLIHLFEKKFFLRPLKLDLFGVNLDLVPVLKKAAEQLTSSLAQGSPSFIGNTMDFFFQLFIFLVVLYYLFREGKAFFSTLVRITPIKEQYERRLANEFKITVHSVFYGSFMTALLQALLATVGFYFIGIDGFLVWGAITFFVSFLPMIGTGAMLVPLALWCFVLGETKQALWVLVYGLAVVGSVDNLARPLLMKNGHMHPVALFLSVFGGLAVFGPTGLLLAPMLMAMLTATLRIYDRDFSGRECKAFKSGENLPKPRSRHAAGSPPRHA